MSETKPYCKFMSPNESAGCDTACQTAEKFCSIIENTIDAIITFDLKGTVTGWNAGAEEIYQYSADEVLGKTYPIVSEDRKAEFFTIIEMVRKGKRLPDYETQRVRKDGKVLDVAISVFLIRDKLGHVTEFCSMHRDITEKKKLQAEMNRARELATIGQLAAGIAHALNTPLASILMSAQMMKDEISTNTSKEDVERIERQTERCRTIVKNLLNLSRPASAIHEPVDINRIIRQVVNNIQPTLREKSISFILEANNNLPMISGDPQTIEEMISNLIANAGDAIANSGTIKVITSSQNGFVIIEISDTGKGIKQEHLARIFDPFFTTKEIGKGSGLGLALCARIAHDHQGTIKVDSHAGKGTTFTITLPVEHAAIPVAISV